jgi:hypothetical protein
LLLSFKVTIVERKTTRETATKVVTTVFIFDPLY